MNCSRCNTVIPKGRIDMGYTICTNCSTEDKVSCHTIYPHKTGGYIEPTLKYLRVLNSSGDIPLLTRVKLQDIITDRYLQPSPRALQRKFNKQMA